jgi:hypothetical protein
MEEINQALEIIGNDIKTALQEVIEDNQLIDTGLLRDSVNIRIENGKIEIFTQDYYKFLDEGTRRGIRAYRLTEQLEQHPLYIGALQKLELVFTQIIIKRLNLQ